MKKPSEVRFWTKTGVPIPTVTADQMREVDRIAMDSFGLGILQMVENAGRILALNVIDMLDGEIGEVTILAGGGGNGGGGICGARHLFNHGYRVNLILDRDRSALHGAAAKQLGIVQAAGIEPVETSKIEESIQRADVVVDALVGYSLRGEPRGRVAELIDQCDTFRLNHARRQKILSLDVPSGLNATTGEVAGSVIRPDRTLTLALPKTGLASVAGELYLADIGIPPEVYHPLGLSIDRFFGGQYWIRLIRKLPVLDRR